MSATLFPEDTLFSQRMFKAEGLYSGELDGIWGPLTEKAARDFEQYSKKIASACGSFDERTEKNINTLTLLAQQEARLFMTRVLKEVPGVKIISGTRSYKEQNRIFRQGRYHNPGAIITNARGGRSSHNFGIAWDVGIFSTTKGYITGGPLYDKVAKAGLTNSLEWGGNWTKFVDKPHYQLKLADSIQLVRKQFEAGQRYVQSVLKTDNEQYLPA